MRPWVAVIAVLMLASACSQGDGAEPQPNVDNGKADAFTFTNMEHPDGTTYRCIWSLGGYMWCERLEA